MKIYIESIILINFFFDFILLFGTSKILHKLLSLKRLILGSITGSLSIILLYRNYSSFELFILKIIISILIIISTFGLKDLKRNLLYFYLLSIILGGTLYLLDISISYKNNYFIFINTKYSLNFIILIILVPLIIYLYVKEHLSYKNTILNRYIVEITISKDLYKYEAILDTGNNLTDPYKNRAVIIIDKKLNISRKKIIYVPYKALNTSGVIPCIIPDSVIINNKVFKNCLIGFSTSKFSLSGASCILPNKFKEDLC